MHLPKADNTMSDHKKGITAYWTPRLQEWIVSVGCIAMIAGMLFSRAVLSMSMILLFVNALHPQKIKQTWKTFKESRFAICCILFFFTYVISGLWSSDTVNWAAIIKIKLPFIFLPFSLINAPFHDNRFRKITTEGILLVLLGGMLYSLFPLFSDPSYLHTHAHLPSPMEGDYIRFTIVLVFGIQFVFWFFLMKERYASRKRELLLLSLWALFAIVYIHIQAAKSGLLCFYMLLIVFVIYYLFRGRRKWIGIVVLIGMMVAGVSGIYLIPSLKKQVSNALYERKVWETQDAAAFRQTSSFVPRLLSYQIALGLIADRPLTGVGAGDMKLQMDNVYERKYPAIPLGARLLPHNQFICTALAVGIPLSLILVAMLVSPMLDRRRNIFTVSTFLVMMLGMMIEPMLETQYAIFVYLFFTLFWMEIPFEKGERATSG
jgi:O-antigen ligase